MAIFLVAMFCCMSYLPFVDAGSGTPSNVVDLEVVLGPNGVDDDYSFVIPDGEILRDIDLELEELEMPVEQTVTLVDSSDWAAGALMDGVNYNDTGLQILPTGYLWDFEGSTQGWSLSSSGGWAHGYDSTLGVNGGTYSGTSAIYTYNGNYPNNMGTTYWATSPTVDCSACSGNWDLKFWKRLGVESASYDKAYVQVKTTSGGWATVYSNPYGSTNDGSFTQSSYDVSSYVSSNSAFQIRFGLGRTDSSVTYTGWNVDDVMIEPRGNTGSGSGNWTSQPFGPGASGQFQMEHSLMTIDAEVPMGSLMTWSLLNADNSTYIPGFVNREDYIADLASIDGDVHPRIRLKIHMESTAESPIIHSVKLGGGIAESFSTDANLRGWSGFSSQSGGRLSGTGALLSPTWMFAQPISGMDLDWSGSGNGDVQYCLDNVTECNQGSWINSDVEFPRSATQITVKLDFTNSYSIEDISIDFHRQSHPANARIDVGLDGVADWSFNAVGIGDWGYQNVLVDGSQSSEIGLIPDTASSISFNHPYLDGSYESQSANYDSYQISPLSMYLTALNSPVDDISIDFSVDGTWIHTETVGTVFDVMRVQLPDSFESDLNSQINGRTPDVIVGGNLDFHTLDISITSSSGGDLLVSGLSLSYAHDIPFTSSMETQLINAVNSQLSSTTVVSGQRTVSIPMVMDEPGRIRINDWGYSTSPGPLPMSMSMVNETETIVAGEEIYEFTSTFDLSNMGVSDAQSHFIDESWSSRLSLSGGQWSRNLDCDVIGGSCQADQGIVYKGFSSTFNGAIVQFDHRIQITEAWPDEDAFVISSAVDMNGFNSQPSQIRFGLGNTMGVEQDVQVVNWGISHMNGVLSPWDALFFDSTSPGIVQVELAFDGLDDVPRSSAYNIVLMVDGQMADSTQALTNGVASLLFNPNPSATEVDLEISVSGLYGQDVSWQVPMNGTFLLDDRAPQLLSSNVEPLDHRSISEPLELVFEIGDRPVLPRHAILHTESSWAGEASFALDKPANLNGFQGEYSRILDTTQAQEGDTISGWLEVIDPAGHALPNSGSEESPLFIIKFGEDGAPVILDDNVGWLGDSTWFHPGDEYLFRVPITDVNGQGDIEEVVIDLAADSEENLILEWSLWDGCSSSTDTIIINDCGIMGDSDFFDPLFTLEVNLSFAWDFNPDSSIERNMRIIASDDSGQSHRHELENRVWRFSNEVEIDTSSVNFAEQGAFVAPGSSTTIVGDVVWSKSGQGVQSLLEVVASIDGEQQFGMSENGTLEMSIIAPSTTGIHPITLDIINLEMGGIDRTDTEEVVAWIVVDGHAPQILQMLSPVPGDVVQERDWKDLEFEIMVNESEGIDIESMRLHWLLIPAGMTIPGLAVIGGNESMQLIAGTGAGSSIPISAIVDLDSMIPETSRGTQWDLWVWVEGQDLAGQSVSATFNNKNSPLAILNLAYREADLNFAADDIVFSNPNPSVGNNVWVNVTVHNDGHVDSSTSVRVEVVESGGKRNLIDVVNIDVFAKNSTSFQVKWIPDVEGTAWVEVSTPDGIFARTDPVQIQPSDSTYIVEGLDGADGGMLTAFGIIAFLMLGLLGYLVMAPRKEQE